MPHVTQIRVLIAAAGIAIWLAYLAGGARGVGAAERDYVFSPAVNPEVQLAASAADVPLGAPTTLSSLAARGSLAVALGRRSAVRDFAAVSAAAATVAFAAVLHAAGLPAVVAVVAMIGMGLGNTFWWRGTTYTPDALFPLLFLVAIWAALQSQRRWRRPIAVLAGLCAVLAIVDFTRPMAGGNVSTPEATGFMSSLTAELTPLGMFLGVVGFVVLVQSRATRVQAAILTVVLLTWHWLWRSPIDPVSIVVVLGVWCSIAVALAWLHSIAPLRSRSLLIGGIAVVLIATPSLTRARLSALGRDLPSEQRARRANDFSVRDAPDGALVIAESRRADAAILLSSRLAGRPVTIVPQSPAAVSAAAETERPIIAFENARMNLERFGFLFERAHVGHSEIATVAGHVPCAVLDDDTWHDVSLLLANGSFIVHGAHPRAIPAGVVIRMAGLSPVEVAAIEPRSIPYELSDVASDAEGVPELLKVARRVGAPAIASMRIPTTGRPSSVTVSFAAGPTYAMATAEDPMPVSICQGPQRSGVMLGGATQAAVSISMNDHAPFAGGWHPVEADPDFFRWTGAPDAAVRLSVTRPGRVRVTITATPASRPAQKPTIGLTVNTCRLEVRAMQAGQGDYEWETDAACWRPGVNELWIHTSPLISPASLFATHDTRLLGARIGAIRLGRAR